MEDPQWTSVPHENQHLVLQKAELGERQKSADELNLRGKK